MFVWQDGANFDGTMNDYMSAQLPVGVDPSNPVTISRRISLVGNLTAPNIILTGDTSSS